MDIAFLQEFIDLAGTCNYHESAENTFISAATLSKHIKKMEEDLGGPLFDRSTRAVTLTKYGEILLPYARQILATYSNCLQDFQSALTIDNSQLNIGFLPMLGRFGVMEFLADFTAAHPDITLNITEDTSLEEQLLSHKYDFIFVDPYGPQNPNVKRILFKTDHMVAILPEEHPLAARSSVTLPQLQDASFVLQVSNENRLTLTSQSFLSACREVGFEPHISKTVRYLSTSAQFVRQGKGIGIMYHSEIQHPAPPGLAVVDITPALQFPIYTAFLPSRSRSDSTHQFLSYLKQHSPASNGVDTSE